MKLGLSRASIAACAAFAVAVALAGEARAQDAPATPQREAARHFEHAVSLYAETDYQGALVEFKRAYAIAPNPTVLYNIGQTEFQLQDYAGALSAFTRYLAEAPPGATHRAEVESSLEVLRTRVGHLVVVTVPPGADVTVDDAPAGKTPLSDRLLVSVGHRKVAAALPGRPSVVRYVDVAADDSAWVTLELTATGVAAAPVAASRATNPTTGASRGSDVLRTLGWVATGMLAAGATGAGVLALKESNGLQSARNTFPVSAATLQADADRTRTYSILADSLGAGAVVVGGITLVATLLSSSHRTERSAQLHAAPTSVDLEVTF
jgi:hypothetical protein